MPRQYPTGLRDEMVRRWFTIELVPFICSDTGVPEQTLHRRKHQTLIDVDLVDGINSTQSTVLRTEYERLSFMRKSDSS